MTQLLTQVTNTVTNSVTTFDNYPFNSFATFQGKLLGAGTSGLFLLDDEASVEAPLATMSSGLLHLGSDQQKRVSDFYLAMRSQGDITLRVATDENEPLEYTIKPLTVETIRQRRSPIGKGLKGTYWRFEVECADLFDYDTMNIDAAILSRRL